VSARRQFREERFVVGRAAEIEENRREPNRSEHIDRGKFFERTTPHVITRHFPLARFLQFAFYAIDQATDGLCRNGALYAGMLDASEQFVAIVLFTSFVSFDDAGQNLLDALPRREAPSTFVAFPTTSNFRSVTRQTRVNDPVAVIPTERTLHRSVRFVPALGI
jgi:hypothetical protein